MLGKKRESSYQSRCTVGIEISDTYRSTSICVVTIIVIAARICKRRTYSKPLGKLYGRIISLAIFAPFYNDFLQLLILRCKINVIQIEAALLQKYFFAAITLISRCNISVFRGYNNFKNASFICDRAFLRSINRNGGIRQSFGGEGIAYYSFYDNSVAGTCIQTTCRK